MSLLLLCWVPLMIDALAIVQIRSNSSFHPSAPYAFIQNVSWLNAGSLQRCIWECVRRPDCQIAAYSKENQTCSMFRELCRTDHIQSLASTSTSVVCYQQNHSDFFFFSTFLSRFRFYSDSIITSSPTVTTMDLGDTETTDITKNHGHSDAYVENMSHHFENEQALVIVRGN